MQPIANFLILSEIDTTVNYVEPIIPRLCSYPSLIQSLISIFLRLEIPVVKCSFSGVEVKASTRKNTENNTTKHILEKQITLMNIFWFL